jgi:hypothetical protein
MDRDRARGTTSVLLVAAGIVLLGLVAWSAARAEVDGGPRRTDVGSPVGEGARNDLALVGFGALAMVVVVLILPFLFRRRDRIRGERGDDSPVSWRRVLVTVLFGFALVYALLLFARNDSDDVEEAPPAPPPEEVEPIETGEQEGATGWAAVALLGTGAAVVLVAAVVLRRRSRGRRPVIDDVTAFAATPELSLLELEQLDPAGAVRAAYAGALRRLAAIGAGRDVAETPREHLGRIGPRVPDAVEPLSVLVSRYEIVRFSHHAVTAEMKADAIRSYRELSNRIDERLPAGRSDEPVPAQAVSAHGEAAAGSASGRTGGEP